MRFDVKRKYHSNVQKYFQRDLDLSRKFAKIMYREFGAFIKCLVLFGSTTMKPGSPKRDLDILIVLDDVRVKFSKELVETYRIITEKAIAATDPQRLHIQSMKFTSFWEYVRAGDPVAINILRSGVSLIDTGVFDPLQALLDEGRIRPSAESIYTYFTMAPASLVRSKQHLLTATVDLYWAAIDAAHSVLMAHGEIPPTPDHVASLLNERLAGKHIKRKYSQTVQRLYKIYKGITHRDIKEISGKDYDTLKEMTEEFVEAMKKLLEKKEI